jgi:hypothetical protein
MTVERHPIRRGARPRRRATGVVGRVAVATIALTVAAAHFAGLGAISSATSPTDGSVVVRRTTPSDASDFYVVEYRQHGEWAVARYAPGPAGRACFAEAELGRPLPRSARYEYRFAQRSEIITVHCY